MWNKKILISLVFVILIAGVTYTLRDTNVSEYGSSRAISLKNKSCTPANIDKSKTNYLSTLTKIDTIQSEKAKITTSGDKNEIKKRIANTRARMDQLSKAIKDHTADLNGGYRSNGVMVQFGLVGTVSICDSFRSNNCVESRNEKKRVENELKKNQKELKDHESTIQALKKQLAPFKKIESLNARLKNQEKYKNEFEACFRKLNPDITDIRGYISPSNNTLPDARVVEMAEINDEMKAIETEVDTDEVTQVPELSIEPAQDTQ